ncbi:RecX family transcriptional regulator [Microbacteriaceae bacterium]|nr:RecX family transcriptional regulator [Candidatus Saccharibacteria bacterium]
MKITDISLQVKNPDRVNVSVDGTYRFSLDILQVGELGIKVGKDYSEAELDEIETESQFGKLYSRALEYTMLRPHSIREVKDYLWKKTRATKTRNRRTGEIQDREGVSTALTDRVFARLVEKKYVDDEKFARWWVENRNLTKGTSRRKIINELRAKGVATNIIDGAVGDTERTDDNELAKIIIKKRARYPDNQKFIQYLMRQGFSYDTIKSALATRD